MVNSTPAVDHDYLYFDPIPLEDYSIRPDSSAPVVAGPSHLLDVDAHRSPEWTPARLEQVDCAYDVRPICWSQRGGLSESARFDPDSNQTPPFPSLPTRSN